MKRTYQMEERKAIQRFRSHLTNDPGTIQLILPLADIAERLRNGVDQMLFDAELQLLHLIMEDEVSWLTGARYGRRRDGRSLQRWGTAPGSAIVHGQKLPLQRTRMRGGNGDVKLGSYELFRRDEEMQRQVWSRVMRGVTEEGLDETLTVHRLGVPFELRRALRTTNPIESAFSRVRSVCQNVKRWRDGNQRERWISSGLIFAEQKFRRIVGWPAMPKLVAILQSYTGDSKKIGKIA
jgi:hypothetical protein